MQYQTIVLELIQDRPLLQNKLITSNSLLSTTEQLAAELRENHLQILSQLQQAEPNQSSIQHRSEAMEIAVNQLIESLDDNQESEASETFSLDGAMTYIKRHTPPG